MMKHARVLFSCFACGLFVCAVFFVSHGSVFAASGSSFRIEVTPIPQCSDGIDNDGDGLIDYPDDVDCGDPNDNNELTATSSGSGPSGGSGGGTVPVVPTMVLFSGYAYPGSTVSILKDGQKVTSVIAGADARFSATLTDIAEGGYLFSVNAMSVAGRRSNSRTFSVYLSRSSVTTISNIVISPTIASDRSEVRKGDTMTVFGESAPNADILISIAYGGLISQRSAKANPDGIYVDYLDTSLLDLGRYYVRTMSVLSADLESGYGATLEFSVGEDNVMNESLPVCQKADLNCDGKVNLVDFSIAAFWFDQTLKGDAVNRERERLNQDGMIDLVDFSIMAYYWTG